MRLFKVVTIQQTSKVYFVRAETVGDAVDEVNRNIASATDQFEPVEKKDLGEIVIDSAEEPLIQYYNYMYKNRHPLRESHIRDLTNSPRITDEDIYNKS